jgi:beta-mannosidase
MRVDLSTYRWELMGYYPWVPVMNSSLETGRELMGMTDWINATVPGGVHLALYRAGLIPHPYNDMDSLACEWVEHRWWMYRCNIDTAALRGRRFRLVFEGLDYEARLYLNGTLAATHTGMFCPLEVDISGQVQAGGPLEIKLLLCSVPDEMSQTGKTSRTFTQKSRFGYKWDFSTRLVNIGIWNDCYIRCEEEAALAQPGPVVPGRLRRTAPVPLRDYPVPRGRHSRSLVLRDRHPQPGIPV